VRTQASPKLNISAKLPRACWLWLFLLVCCLPEARASIDLGPPATAIAGLGSSYRVFGVRDGVPQASVFALAQDRDGLVYLGTDAGLARFDGRGFSILGLPISQIDRVQRLVADPDGSLWIGTQEHGLFRLQDEHIAPVALGAGKNSIEALLLDAQQLWVATPDGLFRCRAQQCHLVAATQKLHIATLLRGEEQGRPCLWIGTAMDGLYRLDDPDSATPVLAAWHLGEVDGMPNDAVRSLAQFGGDLWVGTGRGVLRWNREHAVVYDQRVGVSSAALVMRVAEIGNQPRLQVGTYGSGLLHFAADGSWQREISAQGLPEDYIYDLLETRAGNAGATLWVGTASSGLARRELGRWRVFSEAEGLPHRVVVGVGEVELFDSTRATWVGTLAGSRILREGRFVPLLPPALGDAVTYAMENYDGAIYLGTSRGLYAWHRDGSVRLFDLDNSALPGLAVLAITRSPLFPDSLLLGTSHGVAVFRHGQIIHEHFPNPESPARVSAIARDVDGSLVVGTSNGLFRWDAHGLHELPVPCVDSRRFLDVRIAGKAIWLGSQRGLVRLAPQEPQPCRFWGDLSSGPLVFQLAMLPGPEVFAFGYRGATRLRWPEGFASPMHVEHYGLNDGLATLEFNRAAWVDKHQQVWAGSIQGLLVHDPQASNGELPANNPQPQAGTLRWMNVQSLSGKRRLQTGDTLSLSEADVSFEYALLDYRAEHRHRYRLKLEGLQGARSEFTPDSHTVFNRLPPGNYTAQLWARNADGVEQGPLLFSFRVATPFWRHPFALLFYAGLLTGFGVLIGRLRARGLRVQAKALELLVNERTQALAVANQELQRAAATDTLTGLNNRRYFSQSIASEFARLQRRATQGDACAVVMLLDVDHFKQINDCYGHSVGDAVLVELAIRLQQTARTSDWIVRWGGEEFLILARDLRQPEAEAAALRVLGAIASRPFALEGQTLEVRCSIGMAPCPLQGSDPESADVEECVQLADAALYRAKTQGRNRVHAAVADTQGSEVLKGLRYRWKVLG